MNPSSYGNLCSIFYDATKGYAPAREVDFYAGFANDKHAHILEAMCGSGRLLIPLMQYGYQVVGVDNSATMLNRCRQRCEALDLVPRLYEQSLEDMPVQELKYDLVTIAVGSFQLITDQEAALRSLKNLHAHMHKGASLLIDTFIPNRNDEPASVRLVRLDDKTELRLTTRHIVDESKKLADAYCLYELLIDGRVEESENELIQVTWYTDDEFKALLHKAGFELVKIYDVTLRATGPSHIFHARSA